MSSISRNRNPIMGLWLNEPAVKDPSIVDDLVLKLADAGYKVVRIFLRNSDFTFTSPEIVALVGRAVELAHKKGMLAVLDCEPHLIAGLEMGRRRPEAMGSKLVKAEAAVVDGRWVMDVDSPGTLGGDSYFDGVEAAFLQADGKTLPIELEYLKSGNTHSRERFHREHLYVEGSAISFRHVCSLCGELPGVKSASLTVYLRFSCRTLADFWADGFKSYYDELVETYRAVPLDGIGWDEPAIDGDWRSYRYGDGFAKAFERLNGYRLKDKLNLLDAPGASPEAVKVRLDYYRTLNEGLAQAQANLIAKAREVFGRDDLICGTHHTWQGEGGINDYRAGAIDYFRLNDNMDAGYTDCSWWDPCSVAYAYVLASSLGRLSPSGEAEANTWHFKPTVANVRTNVNLMLLMDITWFNIWVGSDYDTSMQDTLHTWPETKRLAVAHSQFQRKIGKRRPAIDLAIWHGWEGVCAWNRPGLANAQKAFCLNTSHFLIQNSIAADFVDSRLLADSRIEGSRLVNSLGSYSALVIPYAMAMPRAAFEKCVAFAKAGGRLVFVGTPVCFDENGLSLAEDFAKLVEIPAMDAKSYMAGIDAVCQLPNYRPQRLELCRQLSSGLPNKLVSMEGEVNGAVNKRGNVSLLTDLDPLQRMVERIEDVISKEVVAYGGNLLWRLYRGDEGEMLVLAANDERPLRGIVIWKGLQFELIGGSAGSVEIVNGKAVVMGDLSLKA